MRYLPNPEREGRWLVSGSIQKRKHTGHRAHYYPPPPRQRPAAQTPRREPETLDDVPYYTSELSPQVSFYHRYMMDIEDAHKRANDRTLNEVGDDIVWFLRFKAIVMIVAVGGLLLLAWIGQS